MAEGDFGFVGICEGPSANATSLTFLWLMMPPGGKSSSVTRVTSFFWELVVVFRRSSKLHLGDNFGQSLFLLCQTCLTLPTIVDIRFNYFSTTIVISRSPLLLLLSLSWILGSELCKPASIVSWLVSICNSHFLRFKSAPLCIGYYYDDT